VIATGMTLWDWLENPGAVFRGPDGTDWEVVLQTFTSWLIPTFVFGAVAALLCHRVASWVRERE